MHIFQAWGMTETSPVATYSRPREGEHDDAYWDERAKQGRPLPWVELRLVDDDGAEVAVGRRVDRRDRGARAVDRRALLQRRVRATRSSTPAGCAPATSPRSTQTGFVQITDRSKDVIKSGGEWISSVELENEMMSHPDVVEAAVIAKPDERWAERPLCCVVLREGADATAPRARRAPARARGQVVAARRVRVRRGDPEDERGQVRQEGAARRPERGLAGGARARLVSAARAGRASTTRAFAALGSAAQRRRSSARRSRSIRGNGASRSFADRRR